MPQKGVHKQKLSITLEKELVRFLANECKQRTMKLSNYIEKLIRIGLKNEK